VVVAFVRAVLEAATLCELEIVGQFIVHLHEAVLCEAFLLEDSLRPRVCWANSPGSAVGGTLRWSRIQSRSMTSAVPGCARRHAPRPGSHFQLANVSAIPIPASLRAVQISYGA
jgi:hypothetical protein